MTRKELSQLYYLNREIERLNRQLVSLESAARGCTSRIDGMPHVGGMSDKTALAADIADLRDVINAKLNQAMAEYRRLIRYINSIDDSFMRQVFMLRHIDCLSWCQVAQRLGGDNTADGVRKAHKRYLERS